MWTNIALTAVGFTVGVLVTLVFVRRLSAIWGAAITTFSAECVPGTSDVRIHCTLTATDCTITGVFAKIYNDAGTPPPDDPPSDATFIAGTGPSFDFLMPTPASTHADLAVVWPEFSATAGPGSATFGPCVATSPTTTTTSTTTPMSTTTTTTPTTTTSTSTSTSTTTTSTSSTTPNPMLKEARE